jgi:hypothetical protein
MICWRLVPERRAGKRLDERSAEVKRAELRQGQAGCETFERLTVDAPAGAPVILRSIVEKRKASFLERLEVTPDRPRRDAAERRQIVDGHAARPGLFDLPQDRPLTDHFGVAWHEPIVLFNGAATKTRKARKRIRDGRDSWFRAFVVARKCSRVSRSRFASAD